MQRGLAQGLQQTSFQALHLCSARASPFTTSKSYQPRHIIFGAAALSVISSPRARPAAPPPYKRSTPSATSTRASFVVLSRILAPGNTNILLYDGDLSQLILVFRGEKLLRVPRHHRHFGSRQQEIEDLPWWKRGLLTARPRAIEAERGRRAGGVCFELLTRSTRLHTWMWYVYRYL